MSEEKPVAPAQEQQTQEISVPVDVAISLKILEFDKAICDAEAQVAAIKQQKMAWIYEQNIKAVQQKYQNPETAQPETN